MTHRIAKLRAQEAAYRRECAAGYSLVATRRTFPEWLIEWFSWAMAMLVLFTGIDVLAGETRLRDAVASVWKLIR